MNKFDFIFILFLLQNFNRLVPKSTVATITPTSYFRIYGAPNVILDTVKKAEDSDDFILRLYEAYGGHATARFVR